jgi:hypothetical protein
VEAVVGDAHVLHAVEGRRADRAAEGVDGPEPGVVDEDQEDVGCVLGRPGTRDERPSGDRVLERAAGGAAEGLVRDRQHGAVGAELAGRLCERLLQPAETVFVHRGDGLGRRAGERALGLEPVLLVDDRDYCGGAGLELLAQTLLEPAADLVPGEPADEAAGGGADGDRGQQRWSREADEHAHAAAPAHALAAEMVTGLGHADLAALVVLDEDEALALDLLVLDESHEPVEVLLGRLGGRVRGHDDRECVAHWSLLGPRDGLADRSARMGASKLPNGNSDVAGAVVGCRQQGGASSGEEKDGSWVRASPR